LLQTRSIVFRAISKMRRQFSAENLGPARRITIPLAMPALLAGALVAFLQSMTLFGSPAILACGRLPHHDHQN